MSIHNNVLNRRQFVSSAVAACGLVSLAGCGKKGDPSGGTADNNGVFRMHIGNPVSIDPYNISESEGAQVAYQLFDGLTRYNYEENKLEPLACESWDVNDDSTEFTFHLREGAKFHDGTPVTSHDFKRAWNRIVDVNTRPGAPSEVSYHLSLVEGYNEDGNTTDLTGVTCPDDMTLVVKLKHSYSDFAYVVAHSTLVPVPACSVEDPDSFFKAPVGNGPFMMDGEWEDGQYINLKRFDDYYGEPAKINGVTYTILKDVETAYREFEAGNLDYVDLPQAQIVTAKEQYGESEDGYHAVPSQQALFGVEDSVYYLLCNCQDGPTADPEVRKAISLAINREAISETLYHGARVPAGNLITPGIDGYKENDWEYATYDPEKAEAILDAAGYTKDENGSRGLNVTVTYNGDGGHGEIMASVMGDLNAIGIESTASTPEFAAMIEQYGEGDYELGRFGWIPDYPIVENFLYPLFYSKSADNRCGYNRPDIDEAMQAARRIIDTDERIAAWQEINRQIAQGCPVVPIVYYCHSAIVSDAVKHLYSDPMKMLHADTIELV